MEIRKLNCESEQNVGAKQTGLNVREIVKKVKKI